jgi:4-hydroxybenzoate polyprenyltransferase
MAGPPSPEELAQAEALERSGPSAAEWLRLLRPRQWTKNLLLFAALLFARRLFDPQALGLAALGFAIFCAASSSVYVLNDLIDVDRDRRHPEKRRRPIASGAIPRGAAAGVALLLALGALACAFALGSTFGAWTLAYLALNLFYTTVGKDVAVLDVLLIAMGFVIRAIAGAVVIDVPYSEWFILCTLFLAVFLGASKRKAELLSLGDGAAGHRPVLGAYTTPSLDAFTTTSMAAAVLSYALYVVAEHPGEDVHMLAFTVPFVIFGVFRYSLLVEQKDHLGDRPEEVLLQDRPMQLCVVGFALVTVLALYLGG